MDHLQKKWTMSRRSPRNLQIFSKLRRLVRGIDCSVTRAAIGRVRQQGDFFMQNSIVNTRRSRSGMALAISAMTLVSACANSIQQAAPLQPVTRTADASLQWGACPPVFPAGCEIAVLNGNPALPNADIFLRVPGGYTLPPHSHTSAERMILVEGRLTVRYQGKAAEILTPGEYAFGPPGLQHEATCSGKSPCTLFIAFEGPVDAIAFTEALD
jgi:mannose-6-phosphate isomerase-like protein (cupin superfamily)